MKNLEIKKIVVCGFGIAVVFILTAFIAVPIGQFGYVNLGDSGVMLFASILNPALAFLVSGLGSAIADLYLGFSQYALFTLVVKGLEGVIVAYTFKYIKNRFHLVGFVLGMVIMVIGYYFADAFLYSDFVVALGGVGFNFMQGIVSLIVACMAQLFFGKVAAKHFVE